jgi:uncharacterized protein YjbI with pentapeptide repeats
MANEEHLAQLKQGSLQWNHWRAAHPEIQPDLQSADLRNAVLYEVDFRGTDLTEAHLVKMANFVGDLAGMDLAGADFAMASLTGAHFVGANLRKADLMGADLSMAHLMGADLTGANLTGANLTGAHLTGARLAQAHLTGAHLREAILAQAHLIGAHLAGANLRKADLMEAGLHKADLTGADLTGANLMGALLMGTNFEKADLTGCLIHGISAWDVKLVGTKQLNLVITPKYEPVITVDNLEVAQFIYLLLHNEKIREVIDTITSKAVLILGRFTPRRKRVLNAIREELRRQNYLPIVFDFEKPASRDLTETISTLAHIARFIIADLTAAKSIPHELERIVPGLPSVPVQPLLQDSTKEYSMFEHLKRFPWVLPPYHYKSTKAIIASLKQEIIAPAELKAKELLGPVRR